MRDKERKWKRKMDRALSGREREERMEADRNWREKLEERFRL